MEKITFNKKFTIEEVDHKKALTDELYEYFQKKISYPLIRKLINDYGVLFVEQKVLELKKEGMLSWKLLAWHCSQIKILWKD